MDPSSKPFLIYSIVLVLLLALSGRLVFGQKYRAIFSFGDSLTDTGNAIRISQGNRFVASSVLPYGETYFGHPTGRFSDGRLIVDFIAQSMGLQLLPPSAGGKRGDGGVNFAVAGATAMDASYYRERGVINHSTNVSIATQLEWFKQLLPSLCYSHSSYKEYLQNALILMGEIGGNDYNHLFFQGHPSKEDVATYVPHVVNAIGLAINDLIELGAQTLVVPGNLPIGCSSEYLTQFLSPNKTDYDPKTGCLNWLNDFAQFHNRLLQDELDRLRCLHPRANIIYADYFGAAMRIYRAPAKYGFTRATSACCGGQGPYHYDSSVRCGGEGSTVCDDPSSYVSWDGVHLTEAAYNVIASGLLHGPYTVPSITQFFSLNSPTKMHGEI